MKKYFKNLKRLYLYQKFILLFNTIKEIKLTNFQIIFAAYAIIFSIFLSLSIPGLFNYEKKVEEIETKIEQDFKVYLNNLSNIKYRFIPAPHLIIETGELKLSKNGESQIAKLEDISGTNIYEKIGFVDYNHEMIGIVDDIYSHIDDFISSYEVRLKTKLNDLTRYLTSPKKTYIRTKRTHKKRKNKKRF